MGGLKLTSRAWDLFGGREVFFGKLDVPGEQEKPPEDRPQDQEFDRQLFDLLRQKRKEIADDTAVPPYVVFSDRTLSEMVARFPQSPESMLQIHGVGMTKLDKFGPVFIQIIREYCEAHSIEEKPRIAETTKEKRVGATRSARQDMIGEAFNSGSSVEELAKRFNIKPPRVLHYLWLHFQETGSLRAEGLKPLISVQDPLLMQAQAFERLGSQLLRPVFEALDGQVSYEDLKIIRLYHLARRNPFDPNPGAAPGEQPKRIVCLAQFPQVLRPMHSGKRNPGGRDWRMDKTGKRDQNRRVPGVRNHYAGW